MTKEEELYYNNYFDLFGTEGWKQLVFDLTAKAQSYDISYIKDEKDLNRIQGELSVINMLLGLEQFIEQGYEDVTTSN
jgi:hypothetical protein